MGTFGGLAAGPPDDFIGDRVVGRMPLPARKQPFGWFSSKAAKMLAQFSEQIGTEHDVAILAALALMDMDYHAAGVYVSDLEVSQLRSSNAGGIESHQDRVVKRGIRGLDQV